MGIAGVEYRERLEREELKQSTMIWAHRLEPGWLSLSACVALSETAGVVFGAAALRAAPRPFGVRRPWRIRGPPRSACPTQRKRRAWRVLMLSR